MTLTDEDRQRIKFEQLGGEAAAQAWAEAHTALHRYAQRSACPPGHDVSQWFIERRDAYARALGDPFAPPAPAEGKAP
jgi:hypothetical protein